MSKTLRSISLLALLAAAPALADNLPPAPADAPAPPQKPALPMQPVTRTVAQPISALPPRECVSALLPNAELLPPNFCNLPNSQRVLIEQQLADETEIVAPLALKQIEVMSAKKKAQEDHTPQAVHFAGSMPLAQSQAGQSSGTAVEYHAPTNTNPAASAPKNMPVIRRVHRRDGELIAEAIIPNEGPKTLRAGTELEDDWRVESVTLDRVVIVSTDNAKHKITLPSATPAAPSATYTTVSAPSAPAPAAAPVSAPPAPPGALPAAAITAPASTLRPGTPQLPDLDGPLTQPKRPTPPPAPTGEPQ